MKNRSEKSRVFAVSDLHVDYPANMEWVLSLDPEIFLNDVLIVAGDLSHDLTKLAKALNGLRQRFARVFFVPGNHDLWVRNQEYQDSLEKFHAVLQLCEDNNIDTKPAWIEPAGQHGGVWITPLYSWYVQPEQGEGSLFRQKQGEDPTLEMWSDNYFTEWPAALLPDGVATHFLNLNLSFVDANPEQPVITFSHFLPRVDLIFATEAEKLAEPLNSIDEAPSFNFTRVAGDSRLDTQLRALGARVHVYGHQHRNRRRMIDNVLYVSNCRGYPRNRSFTKNTDPEDGLALVW